MTDDRTSARSEIAALKDWVAEFGVAPSVIGTSFAALDAVVSQLATENEQMRQMLSALNVMAPALLIEVSRSLADLAERAT